ncbi:MAG TPA: response regulator [Blastocatellia bacterium]|nr:response regulator [Blastocatellia bacterium]
MTKNLRRQESSASGRVLFIDDDADTCELINLVLGQAGYEVAVGRSIAEGLRLARARKFDLILLDLYFGDGNGIDLCRTVREFDKQTPIFFYTGVDPDQLLSAALEAGAQGCLIKPVEMDTLLQTLATEISEHERGERQ